MNARLAAVLGAALALVPRTTGADANTASVYQLDAPWTDDSGRTLHLYDLRGSVQVLVLFYTTCTATCPVTVKALQMFERDELGAGQARPHFLLVTMDPAHDTPAALRRYRHTMHLDARSFRLVRGSPADVRTLAAVLGFNYEQIESGKYVHSNLVTVLDRRGAIVHQQNSVGSDVAALRDAIRSQH